MKRVTVDLMAMRECWEYRLDMTIVAIAARFGVSGWTVSRIARREGWIRPRPCIFPNRPRRDDLDFEAMRELWECHPEISAAQIGERFGLSKNAVIGHVRRQEWAPRGEGVSRPKATAERLAALNPFPPTGHCVFPIGNPREDGFHFCGDAVAIPQAPYCGPHMLRTHVSAAKAEARLQKTEPARAAAMVRKAGYLDGGRQRGRAAAARRGK